MINGKTYARIAFVIGGKNTNYEKNAELAGKLHKAMEKNILVFHGESVYKRSQDKMESTTKICLETLC